ncbi:hypothetical protein SKAU_G00200350 [Synaphobranchus kaupii]|uniref:Uncharacterized protein n=1 Tax=Synaphobranchus kaupii TaxID=118154 RepID=A0A9Q1FF93_SYNKA|nr:hypothetical protein SKAU_G00200350 [Synaphobranchus kaupii]
MRHVSTARNSTVLNSMVILVTIKPTPEALSTPLDIEFSHLHNIIISSPLQSSLLLLAAPVIHGPAADVDIKRECVLKSLAIYLGERVEDLIKEFLVSQADQAEQELQSTIMAIFIIRESLLHKPKDIGIVIDGVEVLNELPSVPAAMAMLFGLIYALNMEYPKGFKFTFEAIQKILMELGSNKMSTKINRLSSELHDWK